MRTRSGHRCPISRTSSSNSRTSARQNERRQPMSEILRRSNPFRGFRAIFYKEALHLRRDSMAIMFALAVPILEMIILGYAIDTNVRQVKTVVYDQTGIMERRRARQPPEPRAARTLQ